MSDSEFDSNGDLGPERKGPAVEATVPPTAVHQIAQECARAICDGGIIFTLKHNEERKICSYDCLAESDVAERLEQALNAINTSTRR